MRSMRPGRSSASSSACGMFVAIIVRMRYLGGGLGRILSARRAWRFTTRRGFVEEDEDPAVAQCELAQLAEKALHLEDADTHEHVGERARIDEHERLPGLARNRLGHQRLSCSRRAPQQDATRHVSAPLLDRL